MNNPIQFIKMLRSDPDNLAQILLNNNNAPFKDNALNIINSKDSRGAEELARNVCREKGIDADALFRQLRNMK